MKLFKKAISLLLLSLMGLSVFACNPAGTGPSEGTEGTDTAGSAIEEGSVIFGGEETYKIVVSLKAGRMLKTAATRLKKVLSDISGQSIYIVQADDKEEPPTGTKEIVLGKTNRPESQNLTEIQNDRDYLIRNFGDRIVIAGSNDNSIAEAIEYFISTFTGYDENNITVVPQLIIPKDYSYFRSGLVLKTALTRDSSKYYETFNESLQPATDNDTKYIYKNNASQASNCRFTDGSAELVYYFDMTEWVDPKFVFTLAQNYKGEYSSDGVNFTEFVNYADVSSTPIRNMDNKTNVAFNPHSKDIYFDLYIRFTDNDPSDGHGTAVMNISIDYYKEVKDLSSPYLKDEVIRAIVEDLSDSIEPMPVDAYQLHEDNGLIYNPISKEKSASLKKYDNAEKITGEISLDGATLKYEIPKNVTAYDAVPVNYTLVTDRDAVYYVEANAMEDAAKSADKNYYDLALPGKVDVDFEFLGYVCASNAPSNRPVLSASFKQDKVAAKYPSYNASELICSGNIKAADYIWFKIRYTNTGNTILDGDGTGTFCFEPLLFKKENGTYNQIRTAENLYYRIDDEVFPGESGEMWICFNPLGLPAGDYKIRINCLVRNETSNPENYGKNIWGGETYSASTFNFKVTANGAQTEPQKFVKLTKRSSASRNHWLHTYEEFMTSFDSWLRGKKDTEYKGTLYLQCAPWSDQVVLKLIRGNDDAISCAYLPVNVESDSIKVVFNPDNDGYTILSDGTRFPTIQAQSMVDMRGNIQEGPYPEKLIVETLNTMKSIGINTINTTAAFMFDGSNGAGVNNNVDAFWYSADVARKMGIRMEGFVSYPFQNAAGLATAITGESYTGGGFGTEDIQITEAIRTIYQFGRWGDNYWLTADGVVPLSVEDTRGWERVDFNARAAISSTSLSAFRLFLLDLYGADIDALNDAWGSNYKSFYDINPEVETTDDHGYRRYYKGKVFNEWSRPLADFDAFRTLERMGDYTGMMAIVNGTYPTAKLNLRTEGANWLSTVDPFTDNAHFRHVYYSQRRNAIIPELMAETDVIYAHSDYTTLPYTPSEVSELTASSLENGIHPVLLPQFDRMRDIAVNARYGTDFTYDYNLSGKAVKGAYINTVCSVFEWFKATYEAGGTPGILWQDYLCDGYATSTQKKEIAFFAEKLTEALNTPEGKKWMTEFTVNDADIKNTEARYSYNPDFVLKQIEEVTGSK